MLKNETWLEGKKNRVVIGDPEFSSDLTAVSIILSHCSGSFSMIDC